MARALQLGRDARQHDWSELPRDVLPYLLPSRFSPSDEFMRFAQREFCSIEAGGARVLAVLDWLHTHLDYVHGVSHAQTTAEQTFIDRAGVCRDFTHLGIALTRALNIPARAVSAYALDLDPPDFHAIYEVYLDGGWWIVDPTRLAPVEGLVRIASGRDAADIAFLTSDCQLPVPEPDGHGVAGGGRDAAGRLSGLRLAPFRSEPDQSSSSSSSSRRRRRR